MVLGRGRGFSGVVVVVVVLGRIGEAAEVLAWKGEGEGRGGGCERRGEAVPGQGRTDSRLGGRGAAVQQEVQ